MAPSSNRKKLKIVFFVNLIILAGAIPSYLYVDSLLPKPAKFQISNLAFDQSRVQIGTPVEISVDVTNIGDKSGNHSVILTINEEAIVTKNVQLSAAETTTIFFTATELTAGNHTVSVGSLTDTIVVTTEAPTRQAELQLANLGISRTEAGVGDAVTVSAIATNIGDVSGEFSLELSVNNEIQEKKTVHLDGGETVTVYFEVIEDSEGDYVVKLGSLTPVTFSVISDAQPTKPAEFQITQLTIDPSSVFADEVVEVSAKVTNIGEESGSYIANLTIDGVIKDTKFVTLSGGATQVIKFEIIETNAGTHDVAIGTLSGAFTVTASVDASEDVKIKSLSVSPYEVSAGDTVTIKFKADNLINEPGTLQARILLDGVVKTTEQFTLDASAIDKPIEVSVIAEYNATNGKADGFRVEVVNLGNQTNTLVGYFQVAPEGFHTLSVSSNGIGMEFTINDVTYTAPYIELLPEGTYIVEVPDGYEGGGTFWNWTNWIDGSVSRTRTINLDQRVSLTANFLNCKSCPSLYVWDGAEYVYTAEISDGTGYLGIFDYFREDGSLAFLYSVPWDYTKLNSNRLQPKEGYYDMTIRQNWDEIAYVDSATLLIVEHSPDVDVFSTKATYFYKLDEQGTIYTVSKEPDSPVSCITGDGEDVLSLILERDGITTIGNEFQWDTLELNLGDLSNAEEIKLIVAGTILYSTGEEQGIFAGQFWDKPGEQPFPPPYMEVKDLEGNWVPVADNVQFPLLDVTNECFVVNLTDVFLTDDYSLRIHTFFNTQFDYIALDTTPQQDLIIHEGTVSFANLTQSFTTKSTSSGNFTQYGNVTELIMNKDDMYVIMRQGDEITILFPAESDLVSESIERDYFLVASVWFKVDGLPYLNFTVDPLPFHGMTCFPYPDTESYPYDATHIEYLEEYNTRIIESQK